MHIDGKVYPEFCDGWKLILDCCSKINTKQSGWAISAGRGQKETALVAGRRNVLRVKATRCRRADGQIRRWEGEERAANKSLKHSRTDIFMHILAINTVNAKSNNNIDDGLVNITDNYAWVSDVNVCLHAQTFPNLFPMLALCALAKQLCLAERAQQQHSLEWMPYAMSERCHAWHSFTETNCVPRQYILMPSKKLNVWLGRFSVRQFASPVRWAAKNSAGHFGAHQPDTVR